MTKKALPIIGLLLGLVLAGCNTVDSTLADVGSGAAGGAIANKLSDGNTLLTATGAGLGVGLSRWTQKRIKQSEEMMYRSGFQDAMNQNVKQQYWIIQNRQKEQNRAYQCKAELVPVLIPEQVIDGVRIKERVEYITSYKS